MAADAELYEMIRNCRQAVIATAGAGGPEAALMDIAVKENDYLAQSFLQWFIDEQLEEVVKMDRLLSVIRQSGEKNLLMVEAYLVHIEKAK